MFYILEETISAFTVMMLVGVVAESTVSYKDKDTSDGEDVVFTRCEA